MNKNKLKSDILTLSYFQQLEIYRILKSSNSNYTSNNNGIFFNLKYVNDDILEKIYNNVKYYKKMNLELNKIEQLKKNSLNIRKKVNKKVVEKKCKPTKKVIKRNVSLQIYKPNFVGKQSKLYKMCKTNIATTTLFKFKEEELSIDKI